MSSVVVIHYSSIWYWLIKPRPTIEFSSYGLIDNSFGILFNPISPCIIFLDKLLPFFSGIIILFNVEVLAPGKSSIAFDNVSILLGSLIISILLFGYL
jgi:hypothetical protein